MPPGLQQKLADLNGLQRHGCMVPSPTVTLSRGAGSSRMLCLMWTPVAERQPELISTTQVDPQMIDSRGLEPNAATPHSVGRRLIERFALVVFALYHLPLFLNNYPTLGGGGYGSGLAVSWGHVFTPPGVWVARHVLRVAGPMPTAYNGDSGDVAEEFGRLLLAVVIGMVAAVCWTIADRKRPRNRRTGDALRLLLRYSIALGLASFAIAKILPNQFPRISTIVLEQRVGDLTPMALLWTFMEYSRPYAFFAGLVELSVVMLLCVRRTATLGAFICVAAMTNVALLNYAYGVHVRLFATMMVLSAAVLMLYDAPRLIALFVRNEPAPPAPLASAWQDRIATPARWTIKVALVGGVLLSSIVAMWGSLDRSTVRDAEGAWIVTSFSTERKAPDSTRWTQLNIRRTDNGTAIAIRQSTNRFIVCRTSSPMSASVSVTCPQNRGVLQWTISGDTGRVDGTFDDMHVTASARHMKPSDYRLMQSRFRWIKD